MTSLLIALFLGPIQPVHAANYTIKQILTSRNRIVVDNASDLQAGTELIATFKNGTQCTMKVTAVEGRIANADTSYCEGAASLVVGQSLERSLFVEEDRTVSRPVKQSSPNSPPVKTQSNWSPRPPPTRRHYDLQFFPNQGDVIFIPALVYSQNNLTQKNAGKATVFDSSTDSNALRAEMLYGFMQDVTFSLQLSYLVNQSTSLNYGAGSGNNGQKDTMKADGLYDPEFKMGYRWFEQDTMPVIVDLFASWSPGIGKSKTGTTQSRGTAARGGNVFSLGAEVGNKSPGFAFVAGLDMDFYSASTKIDATSGVGTRVSPVSVYTLRIGAQMPVSQSLHVRGNLARITTGGSSTDAFTIDTGPQTELNAALVHEWSDKMLLQFALSKRLESESTRKVGDVVSLSETSDSLSASLSALMTF